LSSANIGIRRSCAARGRVAGGVLMGARLWFLMLNSPSTDTESETGMLMVEKARELERRYDDGSASAAERAAFLW